LLKYRGTDGWDRRPPPRKPGDGYVAAGMVVGICAGGVLGFAVNLFAGAMGIVAGGVCGALLGSVLGSLLRPRK
jgi:hypothetical protein